MLTKQVCTYWLQYTLLETAQMNTDWKLATCTCAEQALILVGVHMSIHLDVHMGVHIGVRMGIYTHCVHTFTWTCSHSSTLLYSTLRHTACHAWLTYFRSLGKELCCLGSLFLASLLRLSSNNCSLGSLRIYFPIAGCSFCRATVSVSLVGFTCM